MICPTEIENFVAASTNFSANPVSGGGASGSTVYVNSRHALMRSFIQFRKGEELINGVGNDNLRDVKV
jgi:hypothetical protein